MSVETNTCGIIVVGEEDMHLVSEIFIRDKMTDDQIVRTLIKTSKIISKMTPRLESEIKSPYQNPIYVGKQMLLAEAQERKIDLSDLNL